MAFPTISGKLPGRWHTTKIEQTKKFDSDIIEDKATFQPTKLQVFYSRDEYKVTSTIKGTNAEVSDLLKTVLTKKVPKNINIDKYVHKEGNVGDMRTYIRKTDGPTLAGSIFTDAGDWKPVSFQFSFGANGIGQCVNVEGGFDEEWTQDDVRIIPTGVAPNTYQVRKIIDDFKNRSTS